MGRKKCEYAIYKGDEFQFIGTARECGEYLGVSEFTFRGYASNRYKKMHGDSDRAMIIINIGVWEDE